MAVPYQKERKLRCDRLTFVFPGSVRSGRIPISRKTLFFLVGNLGPRGAHCYWVSRVGHCLFKHFSGPHKEIGILNLKHEIHYEFILVFLIIQDYRHSLTHFNFTHLQLSFTSKDVCIITVFYPSLHYSSLNSDASVCTNNIITENSLKFFGLLVASFLLLVLRVFPTRM